MAVEEINSNTALYTLGAGAIGATGGALDGWYTTSYLKDGMPNDTFIKKVLETDSEKFTNKLLKNTIKQYKDFHKNIANIKTMDEMVKYASKELIDAIAETVKTVKPNVSSDELFKEVKNCIYNSALSCPQTQESAELIQKILNAKTYEELVKENSLIVEKDFKGKTLEQVKTTFVKDFESVNNNNIKFAICNAWDKDKKQFSTKAEMGSDFKRVVKNIKTKTAVIYGAVTASVLALGTYLFCKSKDN